MNWFNLKEVQMALEQSKRTLPIVLAKKTENYFVASFTAQQLGVEYPWKEVNRRIPGTAEYKYPKLKGLARRTKPILVGTGALRRKVASSIRDTNWKFIRLVVDLPYAEAQNEGTDKMVARSYMKQTAELTIMQNLAIKNEIDKIWRA